MILTLNDSFIVVGKDGAQNAYKFMQQKFDQGLSESLRGRQVTFSVLCKGTSNHVRICLYDGTSFFGDAVFQTPSDIDILTISTLLPDTFSNGSVLIYPDFDDGANGTLNLYAAKLELGDHQTLAHESAGGGGGS